MTEEQREIERLRTSLRERLGKVPPWINDASIQAVRDWKESHKKATKLADKKNATANELHAAINSIA